MSENIQKEIKFLEYTLKEKLKANDNALLRDFENFIFAPSKRIRPKVMFLILKMLGLEILPQHKKLALAVELLHSATLIHDDILDLADVRRGNITFHKKYDTKIATLAGDFLLSLAFVELADLKNTDIINIFSQNILKMTKGEIEQNLQKFKTPTLEEYLEKSKNKTALLFLCAVKSALLISNYQKYNNKLEEFIVNFGIVFQIKNDLKSDKDFEQGIYTLPYILNPIQKNMQCDKINEKGFREAEKFLKNFQEETIKKLNFVNNVYKDELTELL